MNEKSTKSFAKVVKRILEFRSKGSVIDVGVAEGQYPHKRNFSELQARAEEIKQLYRKYNETQGNEPWGTTEYTQGLIGDVGDLSKLILAKNGFREIEDIDARLEHELADCLWSLLVITHELNINLEESFMETMDEIEKKISI